MKVVSLCVAVAAASLSMTNFANADFMSTIMNSIPKENLRDIQKAFKPQATPVAATPAAATSLSGAVYNFAQVRSNQFVETWTTVNGNTVHVRAHVANQRGGLAAGPFAPVVTLAFHDAQGNKKGELKLSFNVPASQKDQWHEIDIPEGFTLWEQSARIVASAAENNAARPPSGSWRVGVQYDGLPPVAGRPESTGTAPPSP
jgi:hypothetical protein